MSEDPPHLQRLNPEQYRAVTSLDGPLLVLAGAGSGKTRVLTRRIAHLLHSGVEPEAILAVTFTRKAAQEMKERVTELAGEAAEKVWVSTFHATCCRILRQDIEVLGWTRRFAIYDDDDQDRVIKDVLARLNIDSERTPIKLVRSRIDYWKNRGYRPERVLRELRDHRRSDLLRAWRGYEEQLEAADAIDFNDLIGLTVRLFTEHPEARDRWREQFGYVLVDEYQDTNAQQYLLLRLLTQTHRNLAVVGDDDQSIYGFRGADIRNILDFERDFPDAQVIRLEQNYRSTGHILHVANTVVQANEERIAKRLWTRSGEGVPVLLRTRDTTEEEARFVARAIQVLHRRDAHPYEHMAVVYRTNATARRFEAALRQRSIPYRIVGGRRFYERREIRDALCFLRLLVNPADDAAFLRIVNVPTRGIGPRTLAGLREAATEAGQPLLEAARGSGGQGRGQRALRSFVELVDTLSRDAREHPPHVMLQLTLERTGYREMLEEQVGPDSARRRRRRPSEAEERLRRLEQLTREAERFEAPADARTTMDQLRAWLDSTALSAPEEEDSEQGEVTLMTVHNAKGLEYPVVFAVQLVEGQFPHSRSVDDPQGVAEERRLAYVAFTRAKQRLIITRSRLESRRSSRGTERRPVAPSRFLFGLPAAACTGDLPRSEAAEAPRPDAPTVAPPLNAPPASSAVSVLDRGARVRHARHGVGTVRNPTDPEAVIVAFSRGRRLVPARELELA